MALKRGGRLRLGFSDLVCVLRRYSAVTWSLELSDAAVCGACGAGHSGWPLVTENIPFLGEQGLVSLQSGRISPCLDLSVARVAPR